MAADAMRNIDWGRWDLLDITQKKFQAMRVNVSLFYCTSYGAFQFQNTPESDKMYILHILCPQQEMFNTELHVLSIVLTFMGNSVIL